MDPVWLKEQLAKKILKFELHDKDQIKIDEVKESVELMNIEQTIESDDENAQQKYGKGGKGGDKRTKVTGKGKKAQKETVKPPEITTDRSHLQKRKGISEPRTDGDLQFEKPLDKTINNNYGVAQFMLTDFLKPNVRKIRLSAAITPIQRYDDSECLNLDLNTTARQELKKLIVLTSYLDFGSYLVVTFEIAHEIGAEVEQEATPDQEVIDEEPQPRKGKDKTKKVQKIKIPDKKAAKLVKESTQRSRISQHDKEKMKERRKEEEERRNKELLKLYLAEKHDAIYERAIYVIPYESKNWLDRIQNAFTQINLKGLGIENGSERDLNTKALNEVERANRHLDVLTGFELIDFDKRMYVFEGLSEGAMAKIEKYLPIEAPNSEKIKILKNKDILFQEREYLEYNVGIKKIKFRDTLAEVILDPNIYIRTKLAENIYETICKLHQLRDAPSIQKTRDFDYFPTAKNLNQLERKYGDSLNKYDHTCTKAEKHSTKFHHSESLTHIDTKTTSKISLIEQISYARDTFHRKSMINIRNLDIGDSVEVVKEATPPITQDDSPRVNKNYKIYNLQMKSLLNIPKDNPVYTYGGQKRNFYEMQKACLRKQIRKDSKNFYTYSKRYMNQTINPYTIKEAQKKRQAMLDSLMKTQAGFTTYFKKDKLASFISPKQLHPSQIYDLQQFPYHLQKKIEMKQLKSRRGLPISDPNKPEFYSIVKKTTYFSIPKMLKEKNLSAAEREKQIIEDRRKEYETWRSKLKVKKTFMKVNMIVKDHPSQIDKANDIREGKAIKKGLLLGGYKLKDTKIRYTKSVLARPISIFSNKTYVDPYKRKQLARISVREKDISTQKFKMNTRKDIFYSTDVLYKPLNQKL